jgi:hypothetical protein
MKKIAALLCGFSLASGIANAENDLGYYRGGECAAYVELEYLNPHGLSWSPVGSARRAWDLWEFGYGKDVKPKTNAVMVLDAGLSPHGHVGMVSLVNIVDYNAGQYRIRVNEVNARGTQRLTTDVLYTVDTHRSVVQREGLLNGHAFPEQILRGFIYTETDMVDEKINRCIDQSYWLFGQKTGRWEDNTWKIVYTSGYYGAVAVQKTPSSNPYAWRYSYSKGWETMYCY